jgi:hypothetical protein
MGLGTGGQRGWSCWTANALDHIVNNANVRRMTKRLRAIGNSAGHIIDRPILDLLDLLAKVQTRALRRHAETFRKLAK